jgi:hypothetical protein
MSDEQFERLRDALNEHGRSAVAISGDLEDGINADHQMATAERDGLLAALAAAEADRDRARDAAVALEQEAARVREYAEHLTGSANRAYAKAGRELLAILDGGER